MSSADIDRTSNSSAYLCDLQGADTGTSIRYYHNFTGGSYIVSAANLSAGDIVYYDADVLGLTQPTIWSHIFGVLTPKVETRLVESEEVIDEVTKLRRIKHYLSLNTSQLAETVMVERQSVYAWLSGDAKIRKGNRGRIDAVYSIAKNWWEKHQTVLSENLLTATTDSGPSLFDLLKANSLDVSAITRRLSGIAATQISAGDGGEFESFSATAEKRGFARVSEEQKDSSIRSISRQRRRVT